MAAWLWGAAHAQPNSQWFELEKRLTMNCDERRAVMPVVMGSCTPRLLVAPNYKSVTVNGVTLMSAALRLQPGAKPS